MAADQWSCAQRMLDAWPDVDPAYPASGTCMRLRDALVALRDGRVGAADVAALIRQVLLEHEGHTGIPIDLRVPVDSLLPDADTWRLTGCRTWPESGASRVLADAWHPPTTAPDEAFADPQRDQAAVEDLRQVYMGAEAETGRTAREVPADPFWRAALGYPSYLSVSQRQAARTVALAPPGSTVLVCLPTGNGKTAVVEAAALLQSQDVGVSVVVVPTVVLALDMERGARALLRATGNDIGMHQRLAYTGGLPDEVKQTIREDVRAGRQRLLFTSPEALVTGLSGAVTEAAEAGLLRFLVIDEAHLVEQWGNEFRPEFQLLAGLRETLLDVAPPGRAPVTVAMSATLTDRHVTTLASLYGNRGETAALVWASALREEPAYFVGRFADQDTRAQAVLEAVARLPRPMVLYTSTRQDANHWASRLRTYGFRRVTAVTGDSTDAHRQEAVEGWRGQSTRGDSIPTAFDIVIGTSAFGLGVDMPDVRSIVHACIPETIDRYYQEVGRSGRDGHPSVSYLAWCPTDEPVAKRLNEVTVITAERGWERWQRMQHAATRRPDGVLEVDLAVWPGDMSEGFRRNQQWNLRTLNLMQVGGLIRLRSPRPPQRGADESTEQWAARLDAFYAAEGGRIHLELLDGQVNNPDYWKAVVDAQRHTLLQQQHQLLDRMRDVLAGRTCIGQLLARHYRARWQEGKLGTQSYCRGCPRCRGTGNPQAKRVAVAEPLPAVHAWSLANSDPLEQFRGRQSWLSIGWASERERLDLVPHLLERLARRGMSVISGSGIDADLADRLQAVALPHAVIVDQDSDLLTTFEGPLVVVLPSDATELGRDVNGRLSFPAPTYLLHPVAVVSPERPHLRLGDMHSNHLSVARALDAL